MKSTPDVNAYYGSDQDRRAERVQSLFNRIADRYDLINDLQSFGLHRLWKRQLLKLAKAQPGQKALDVCCGTGDIALRLAAANLDVTGVDFSARMLEQARQRGATHTNLQFLEGDALALPFDDATFDLVTIGYGLRNLVGFEAALTELTRVLKPGGNLLILDFGKPKNPHWRRFYFAYLGLVVPLFGRLFCGDAAAYSYILESLRHYPAQQGVADMLASIGFESNRIHDILGGVMAINEAVRPSNASADSGTC